MIGVIRTTGSVFELLLDSTSPAYSVVAAMENTPAVESDILVVSATTGRILSSIIAQYIYVFRCVRLTESPSDADSIDQWVERVALPSQLYCTSRLIGRHSYCVVVTNALMPKILPPWRAVF